MIFIGRPPFLYKDICKWWPELIFLSEAFLNVNFNFKDEILIRIFQNL